MEDNRLAKIARDSRPQGVRSRGGSKKRWKESLIKAPRRLNLWKNRREPIEKKKKKKTM
jgi:hypothetical protein